MKPENKFSLLEDAWTHKQPSLLRIIAQSIESIQSDIGHFFSSPSDDIARNKPRIITPSCIP